MISFEEWIMSENITKSWHMHKIHQGELKQGLWLNDFSLYTIDNYIKDCVGQTIISKIFTVENLNEGMQEVFETIGIKNDYFIAKKIQVKEKKSTKNITRLKAEKKLNENSMQILNSENIHFKGLL